MFRPQVPNRPIPTPVKHRRYPWEVKPKEKKRMSICIAAKNPARVPCREVVVCCDTKVSTESLSAETGKGKLHLLGPRWCVLTAGVNPSTDRSEEHTSELQSLRHLVCRL